MSNRLTEIKNVWIQIDNGKVRVFARTSTKDEKRVLKDFAPSWKTGKRLNRVALNKAQVLRKRIEDTGKVRLRFWQKAAS
jgi:hypothetical protein